MAPSESAKSQDLRYVIEHRTPEDRTWRVFVKPPLIPGWTAREAAFADRRAAEDACEQMERNARHLNMEFRVLYLNQLPELNGSSARWRRKLGETPLDQLVLELREKLAAIDEKRDELTARLSDAVAQTRVKCLANCYGKGCGQTSAIRDLVYLQTHWYVPPSGCSDGDYWRQGEGMYECLHCGHMNRLYERADIEALKHLFRGVVDTYDRNTFYR